MKPYMTAPAALLAGLMALGPLSTPSQAQTTTTRAPQPGFNLFTVQQDVDLGRQSAVQAEKQLPILRDATTDQYLNRIVQRLAAAAPGARYPYTIKAVNDPAINAFALPGGPMYVNRGLLQSARSEAELAGVLAHEMSHVALRHGTTQASKAYLANAGVGILGGLLGRQTSSSQILNTIGGVGLNAVFLKFSRDDEYQADRLGTEIMAKAGYDPNAMASMFELLRAQQNSNPSSVATFFSDHPAPADREARIRQYASTLSPGRTQLVGSFPTIQARLRGLTASGSTSQVGRLDPPPVTNTPGPVAGGGVPIQVSVPPPSSRFVRFRQASGFFTIDFPNNWRSYQNGYAVTLAPPGGIATNDRGAQVLLEGIIVNHYSPFEGTYTRRELSLQHHYAPFEDTTGVRGTLEDATDDLVRNILRANRYLRAEDGSARPETIDGAEGFSVVLSGISPVTGEEERGTLFTRSLPDGHVVYALAISPARDAATMDQTVLRMMRTLNVNDAVYHRSTGNTGLQPD